MMERDTSKITQRIGFIGGGNMARAIFDGITNKKLVNIEQIYVAGPHQGRLSYFKEKGAKVTESNNTLVKLCDVIFICVKPNLLSTVVQEVDITGIELYETKIFVSVLAATSIRRIEDSFFSFVKGKFHGRPLKLIRVMPNTPLAVGEGCCLFTPNKIVDASDIALIRILLESSGLCLEVPESQINAMASISGSGPAFMFSIIEAMADGGVKMGVPRSDAIKLAAQAMLGAAKMVLHSGKHSAQLKDEVCSAGGTTIAGIHALEKQGVRSAMIDAIEAATKRAAEMQL